MNTSRGVTDMAAHTSISPVKSGPVQYRRHRSYKSTLAFQASRIAVQAAMNEINQLYPRYLERLRQRSRTEALKHQQSNMKILVKNQQIFEQEGFGSLLLPEPSLGTIYAADVQRQIVPEALMLYHDAEDAVQVPRYSCDHIGPGDDAIKERLLKKQQEKGNDKSQSVTTKRLCHIDLAPHISLSSTKNVILTPVQGRDFTRKELVSGGDFQFTVSGQLDSNLPGVYPSLAVKIFLANMQYGGILKVHHFMFKQLGVTSVIIKDWHLDAPEYKNIQPYSFTCVAVEPDEIVEMKDTIQALDNTFDDQTKFGFWERLLLDEKTQQIVTNAGGGLLNSSISELSNAVSGKI